MAPPAPLARSLGLGADPPGRAPPAGSRRPAAQPGAGQRSPPPLWALPTPSAEACRRRSLREARPRWRAALLPAGLPLIQWMATLLFCLRVVQNVPPRLSGGVPSELQPHCPLLEENQVVRHSEATTKASQLCKTSSLSESSSKLRAPCSRCCAVPGYQQQHRRGDHTTASLPRDLQARCGGAAGVVNQAVANQRTATSQHQGHTSPRAPAAIQTAQRLGSGTHPSPSEPQHARSCRSSCVWCGLHCTDAWGCVPPPPQHKQLHS
ncbi:uncharacterized protein LOC117802795 [Ailuropoda melanoleuca]|uniref:uncharacterized protein LOC117802795 n=1 Tax=Ailuropoda melanoleuca TaxID=9646 RepID=UPI001494A97F|nr:uncharacterized protein LOC117802795 [Ailuropoda melanoleuca]